MGDFVQVQPDSSGKQVEAKARPSPDGVNTVYRQTVEIGDDEVSRTNLLLRRILEELVRLRMIAISESGMLIEDTRAMSDEDLGI